MSSLLRTYGESLMDLGERTAFREDDLKDAFPEPEATDSYAMRFAELLSIFLPEKGP